MLEYFRRSVLFQEGVVAYLFLIIAMPSFAAAPDWWSSRGVIVPGKSPDDYAVINQGQLKRLTASAVMEMNAQLPAGAGPNLNALVASWSGNSASADDYAVVTVGQLKKIGALIYERLQTAGSTVEIPGWLTTNSGPNDDFALANLGQAKHVFGFGFPLDILDSDGDQIPDSIEMLYYGHPTALRPGDDLDGDGITNLQEYLAGTPLDGGVPNTDKDGDGIPDTEEDQYPGVLNKYDPSDAVADPDADGILNIEEIELNLRPDDPNTADQIPPGPGQTFGQWHPVYDSEGKLHVGVYFFDPAGQDSPDLLAARLAGKTAWNMPVNKGDTDGDEIPDLWEHKYRHDGANQGMNWRTDSDRDADPDNDGLSNYWEFRLGYHPFLADTDGNGISDGNEDFDADGISNAAEILLDSAPDQRPNNGIFVHEDPVPYTPGQGGSKSNMSFEDLEHLVIPQGVILETRYSDDYTIHDPKWTAWSTNRSVSATSEEVDGWWEERYDPVEEQGYWEWVSPSGKQYYEYKIGAVEMRLRALSPRASVVIQEARIDNGTQNSEVSLSVGGDSDGGPPASDTGVHLAPSGGFVTIRASPFIERAQGYIVSAKDAAGSRYRKVALNGVPMPDSPPVQQDESGMPAEETFIDAYTRQLRHSTTDAFARDTSSLLPLMVRRDIANSVWNERSGLLPHEDPTQPFGPGWTSNLTSYIRFTIPSDDRVTAEVIDEMGSRQVFIQYPTVAHGVAWVHNREECLDIKTQQNTLETSSLGLVDNGTIVGGVPNYGNIKLVKKFGTTCFYEMISPGNLRQTMTADRRRISEQFTSYTYARLLKVSDRWGNELHYEYQNADTLIPSRIHDPKRPGFQIQIFTEDNLVNRVVDGNGNVIEYFYSLKSDSIWRKNEAPLAYSYRYLTGVKIGESTVTYNYEFPKQADYHNPVNEPIVGGGEPTVHSYINLNSITDELGRSYSFEYEPHLTVFVLSNDGKKYRTYGLPYLLTKVQSPMYGPVQISGSRIVDPSLITTPKFSDKIKVAMTGAVTILTAAGPEGSRNYQYHFSDPSVLSPHGVASFDKAERDRISYTFKRMKIVSPDLAEEIYEFEPAANFALKKVTDRNGNTREYEYEDALPNAYLTPWKSSGLGTVVMKVDGLFYDDPTLEKLGEGVEKRNFYSNSTRLLTHTQSGTRLNGVFMEDATPYYDYDDYGRLEKEYDGYQFKYLSYEDAEFPGLVTKITEGIERNLVQLYSPFDRPHPNGHVKDYVPDVVTNQTLSPPTKPGWWRTLHSHVQTQAGLATTSTVRDYNGNVRSVKDSRGFVTNFYYDRRSRLIKTVYPDGATKELKYDLRGNLTQELKEDGSLVFHEYDKLNRRTKTTIDLNGNRVADPVRYNPTNTVILENPHRVVYDGDIIVETTFNSLNLPVNETDARGVVTHHEYDSIGRKILTIYNYHANSNPADEYITRYIYKRNDLNDGKEAGSSVFDISSFKPVAIEYQKGHQVTFEFDSLYREVKMSLLDESHLIGSLANKVVITKKYDSQNRVYEERKLFDYNLATGTHAQDRLFQFFYDTYGRLAGTQRPDNSQELVFYTPSGKVWRRTVSYPNGGEVETTTVFDTGGYPVEEIGVPVPVSGQALLKEPIISKTYDLAGNVVETLDPLGNVTVTAYDSRNRPYQVTHPLVRDAVSGADTHPVAKTEYDRMGRVIKATDPLNRATRTYYDLAGRAFRVVAPAVDGVSPVTTSYYDAAGSVVRTVNPLGQNVYNTYDAHGRLKKTLDQEGIENEFDYDPEGNRILVVDGLGQETTFAYDAQKRLLRQTYQNGDEWTYSYNALFKTGEINANNVSTAYTYDVMDRLLTVTHPGLSRVYTYNDRGDLEKVEDAGLPQATVEYGYDDAHRLQWEKSQGVLHDYEYDLAGNRVKAIYGTGHTVQTDYDALNRPQTLTEGGRVTGYGYDLAGQARELSLGNGQATVNVYDNLGRLKSRVLYSDTTQRTEVNILTKLEWTYDLAGNVKTHSENWPGSPARGSGTQTRVTTLEYDGNNRMESEVINDPTAGLITTTYTYDAANNRDTKEVVGGSDPGFWDYHYNDVNQLEWFKKYSTSGGPLVQQVSYGYDDNGNRTSRTVSLANGAAANEVTAYGWTALNQLDSVTLPDTTAYSYKYDYRVRRIGIERSGGASAAQSTSIVFAGGLSLAEYESATPIAITAGSYTVHYSRGPDMGGGVGGMLYSHRPQPTGPALLRYNLSNGRGDIVAQSDSSGTLTWTASYEAYGKRTTETGTNADKQRANSKDEDPTGLLNEGFRYRDIETGVWLSRDPAGFVDGPNLYAYVQQNPWSKFDAEGLFWSALVTAGFALYDTYQYATGQMSGGEYARNMTVNGAAFLADAATGGMGGGLAVRTTMLGCRAKTAIVAGAKLIEKADNIAATVESVHGAAQSIAEGNYAQATMQVASAALTGKSSVGKMDVPKFCFAADTPVHTHAGLFPIQKLQVGQRVYVDGSNEVKPTEVRAGDWLRVEFSFADPATQRGKPCRVVLLRPSAHVAERGWQVGAEVEIDFGHEVQRPSGFAQVVSITAAETPEVEAGGVVTGTFQTWYRDLRELWVEGLKTPVRVTSGHRFYSANRQTWIAAQHLQIGETIRTRDGAGRRVLAVETLVGEHPVYNLEVETVHQYHVTSAGLLTHNNEGCPLTSSQQMTAEVSEDLAAKSSPGKSLLPGEGAVGTYDDLIAAGTKGDNITPHHIPSANHMAQHGVSKGDGIAINMEQPFPGSGGRHRATFTYGTQADLNLTPRQALGQGIWDARRIYQQDGLYGPGIRSSLQDVIRQNRAANPGLFDK